MLNRTNRTILATTNRLNLGTRSLDQISSGNTGNGKTLRFAHVAHPVAVRAGVVGHPAAMEREPVSILGSYPIATAMSSMSGSSSEPPQRPQRAMARSQKQGQPLASKPRGVRSADDRQVIDPTRRSEASPIPSPGRHSRKPLGWRPLVEGLAGRSARVVLVSVATP